jgi:PAS domain S-box-containing protein
MHASTREWFPEFFKRFKEQGYVNNLEYELLRKDGAILSALISSVAIYDEAGNYLSSWSTVFNLTERKRTDRELRETTERFRLLVDSVSDYAMIILDKTGCVTSWNPGAERITGYKAGEIFGKHYYCFYTAAALQSSDPSDELQMAILNGRAELEGWRVRKDGSNFWAHVIVAPLRDEAGTPTSFSMIFRDLTQRRQSEEAIRTIHAELEKRVLSRTNELVSANRALEREVAGRRLTEELLQQSEARIAAILQSAGDGIISIDEWGTVELFNPAAEALFGFSAAEVLGRHIKMLMPSPHAELCEDYLLRYRQTREKRLIGLTRELTGLRKNGTTFPIELRVSEVNLASRRIFSGIIRDITDRKLAETAMRKRTIPTANWSPKTKKTKCSSIVCRTICARRW